MKRIKLMKMGIMVSLEEHMCPKYFTNVWKTCRRSI